MYGTVEQNEESTALNPLLEHTKQEVRRRGWNFFKDISSGGSKSVRFLGFAGSGVTLVLCIFQVLGDIFSPIYFLLDLYLLLATCLTLLMESTPYCRSLLLPIELKVEYWAKFMTRSWGKALLYCFIASIGIARFTIIWMLLGFYMIFVAVLHYQLSVKAAGKLNEMRQRAMENLEGSWDQIFSKYDKDRDGCLSMDELNDFASAMGVPLTMSEEQTIIAFLDPNRNGKVQMNDFKEWWTQNKLTYI